MSPTFLTVDQVAEAVKLSRSTVYELVRTGELEAIKIRGQIRVPYESYSALIESSRVEPRAKSGPMPTPLPRRRPRMGGKVVELRRAG